MTMNFDFYSFDSCCVEYINITKSLKCGQSKKLCKMDCDKKSLHFVIEENLSFTIKNHKTHVNDLFGVTVSLENTQQNKRWVNLKGPEEHLSRAKVNIKENITCCFCFLPLLFFCEYNIKVSYTM